MSSNSRRQNSRHSRSSVDVQLDPSQLSYSNVVLAPDPDVLQEQHQPFQNSEHQFQNQGYPNLQSSATYLHSDYPPRNQTPNTSGSRPDQQLFTPSELYYPDQDPNQAAMMSHRDMGYGYMPGPAPLPSYTQSQPYGSTLAPLPGYYPEQTQRNISGSLRPNFLPNLGFQAFHQEEKDAGIRRRRRNSQESRRQAKLRVRKAGLPRILGMSAAESSVSSSPVDFFATAPAPTAYVSGSIDRSFSRPSMPSSMSSARDDYRHPVHHSYNVNQSYQPTYSMGAMSAPTLAPPILPNSNPGYPGGRSSPFSQAPLPPAAPSVSPHLEPVVLDRREKPQCWEHGCNGREFSTFSNLLRHQREKSGSAAKSYCPHCGAEFTRTTARNGHMEHGKCKSRRQSDTSTR